MKRGEEAEGITAEGELENERKEGPITRGKNINEIPPQKKPKEKDKSI